jgi:hypothetical protein
LTPGLDLLRSRAVSRPKPWRLALALGATWFGGGCGPIEYVSQVGRRVPAALAQAQQHGAERLAPYEFTAAQEYLRAAQVEATRSSYQRAVQYGRRAEELAVLAEGLARERTLRTGADTDPAGTQAAPRP